MNTNIMNLTNVYKFTQETLAHIYIRGRVYAWTTFFKCKFPDSNFASWYLRS